MKNVCIDYGHYGWKIASMFRCALRMGVVGKRPGMASNFIPCLCSFINFMCC